MDVLRRANELEASGRSIKHLEVGQPCSGAPASAVAAAADALRRGDPMGYTNANGVFALQQRISDWYREKHGEIVNPNRVVVTTGSSAGFVLAFTALFDAGDAVGVPTTAYPCYRNVLGALGCAPVPLSHAPTAHTSRAGFAFPRIEDVLAASSHRVKAGEQPLKGLILSSPSNPTGATLDAHALRALATDCAHNGVRFISDEIYHHITYGDQPSATAVNLPGAITINSFSKFFSMTGWRVGWLVLPEDDPQLASAVERLQQNLFINAPTISQIAATAAFDDAEGELASHVTRYAANRAIVLDGLARCGVDVEKHTAPADGAFYVYADLRHYGVHDTPQWCAKLLDDAGLALTPGSDFEFDQETGNRRVRFSYSGATDDVAEAMDRLHSWWTPTSST